MITLNDQQWKEVESLSSALSLKASGSHYIILEDFQHALEDEGFEDDFYCKGIIDAGRFDGEAEMEIMINLSQHDSYSDFIETMFHEGAHAIQYLEGKSFDHDFDFYDIMAGLRKSISYM